MMIRLTKNINSSLLQFPTTMIVFVSVAAVQILIAAPAKAQQASSLSDELKSQLSKIATQDVPSNAPGIATGMVQNGEVVFTKCAGLADIANESPITSGSRFNIASNGKQFTALATLILEADNKLSLDDDIRMYLPNLFPKVTQPITIEHLINHSSGIRDVYDLWSLKGLTWWKHSFDNGDALELLQNQDDLNFDPGTKYLYSNSNYILLTEIVEKASGKSFIEFTNDMFRDLNMPNTSFESEHKKIRGPISKPYFNFETWIGYEWIWDAYGDGNIFSTLDDQLQWESIVQGHGKTQIDRQLIERSQQPVENSKIKNYGYGLEFANYKGLKQRFHAGGTGAWKAYTIRFPEKNVSIVTLSNSGKTDVANQSRQMADAFLELKSTKNTYATEPASIGDHVSIDDIAGTYLTEQGYAFKFISEDQKFILRRSERGDVLLERESANIFHQIGDPAFKQEFTKNAEGQMQVTAYYNTHEPYSLTRPANDWQDYDFKKVEGEFLNSETGVRFKIAHVSEDQYSIELRSKSRNGLLIGPGKMISGNYSIEWTDENANQLLLNGSRIRQVKFRRVQ